MCGFVAEVTTSTPATKVSFDKASDDGSTWTYGVDELGELVRCQGPHNKKRDRDETPSGSDWSDHSHDDFDDAVEFMEDIEKKEGGGGSIIALKD